MLTWEVDPGNICIIPGSQSSYKKCQEGQTSQWFRNDSALDFEINTGGTASYETHYFFRPSKGQEMEQKRGRYLAFQIPECSEQPWVRMGSQSSSLWTFPHWSSLAPHFRLVGTLVSATEQHSQGWHTHTRKFMSPYEIHTLYRHRLKQRIFLDREMASMGTVK